MLRSALSLAVLSLAVVMPTATAAHVSPDQGAAVVAPVTAGRAAQEDPPPPTSWESTGVFDTEAECTAAGRNQRYYFTCRHEWWEIGYRWRLWLYKGDPVTRNASGPAGPRQRPDWEFEASYYRYAWCGHAGANGVPRYWTAYQCRTVHLGGDEFRYDLWVCHKAECRARARH